MKKLKLIGFIAFFAIIGILLGACDWLFEEGDPEQTVITITGIDSQYNGKFAWLQIDHPTNQQFSVTRKEDKMGEWERE